MAVQVLVYKQANKHLKHDNIVMRASAVISIELLLISNVGYDCIVSNYTQGQVIMEPGDLGEHQGNQGGHTGHMYWREGVLSSADKVIMSYGERE